MLMSRKPHMPHARPRSASASLWQYLRDTSVVVMLAHTLLFLTWASIGIFFYDALKTVGAGRPLVESTLSRMIISGIHIDSFMKTQKQIGELLAELRQQTGAARAMLVLFTNGKASVGGVPFIHASAYAESHDAALTPCLPQMQDLDIIMIPDLDRTLMGESIFDRPAGLEAPGRSLCTSAVILRGPVIRTFNGKPHGYIALSWNAAAEPTGASPDTVRQRMAEYSFIFAGILSTVDIDRLISQSEIARP